MAQLVTLGLQVLVVQIRAMTNNPKKLTGLEGFGLEITDRVPLEAAATDLNHEYLEAKRDKLGHLLGS